MHFAPPVQVIRHDPRELAMFSEGFGDLAQAFKDIRAAKDRRANNDFLASLAEAGDDPAAYNEAMRTPAEGPQGFLSKLINPVNPWGQQGGLAPIQQKMIASEAQRRLSGKKPLAREMFDMLGPDEKKLAAKQNFLKRQDSEVGIDREQWDQLSDSEKNRASKIAAGLEPKAVSQKGNLDSEREANKTGLAILSGLIRQLSDKRLSEEERDGIIEQIDLVRAEFMDVESEEDGQGTGRGIMPDEFTQADRIRGRRNTVLAARREAQQLQEAMQKITNPQNRQHLQQVLEKGDPEIIREALRRIRGQ